jgi:hypothetical protein
MINPHRYNEVRSNENEEKGQIASQRIAVESIAGQLSCDVAGTKKPQVNPLPTQTPMAKSVGSGGEDIYSNLLHYSMG